MLAFCFLAIIYLQCYTERGMSRISAITAVMSNIVYVIPFTWYIESMSLKRCHKVDMCEEQESLPNR